LFASPVKVIIFGLSLFITKYEGSVDSNWT